MNDKDSELKRLDFEDILWIIFIGLSILNIVSNNYQKEYIVSEANIYKNKANNVSLFVLSILLLVYLYFFYRNYKMFNNKEDPSDVDFVKVIGSLFFIIGTLCLLYFQINSEDNFIGGPIL